jgi:hypothetical protein
MKHFRLQTFKTAGSGSDSEESESEDDESENNPAAIKRRHRRELERAERETRENTSALLELRDLEDECNTLSKLFETQESVIRTMKTIYTSKELRDITGNGQFYLEEALEYLDEYKQQAKDMLKRVDTVRNDVSHSRFPFPPQSNTLRSTRKCSKWSNVKPRSTKSAGRACKPNSPPRRT